MTYPAARQDGRPRRIEPCVCGGVIVADPDDPRHVTRAVVEHQQRPAHRQWRELGGFDFDPELLGRAVPA